MKCSIHVNRHIQKANLKSGHDVPAISVRTHLGTISAHNIKMQQAVLIQDGQRPRSCGATIWIEAQLESLIIDGVPATADMFVNKGEVKNA